MIGDWPPMLIDHRDGDGTNNRWSNLRSASSTQNLNNARRRCNNSSGFKGVYFNKKEGRYMAQIRTASKRLFLGLFDSAEEAHAAYVSAAKIHHGEFANSGEPTTPVPVL
jgi:hypothetical protein